MIWAWLLPSVLLLVCGGAAARDAWLDRTPMRPWTYARPELAWWAHRQTKREQARSSIAMEAKR